jgi:hypothetical protein
MSLSMTDTAATLAVVKDALIQVGFSETDAHMAGLEAALKLYDIHEERSNATAEVDNYRPEQLDEF